MLRDFISAHRSELVARARAKVAARPAPRVTDNELHHGVPLFLDQLIEALRQQAPSVSSIEAIGVTAGFHGGDMLNMGFTVAQVVHGYGDVCQAVTELAVEKAAAISTEDFHTLNRCLDDAIAQAVTEYSRLRELSTAGNETERSGVFAHELRNRVSAVQMAFEAIKSGRAPLAGSVSAVVTRNLYAITALINRQLIEVRLDSGHAQRQRLDLRQLVEDADVEGAIEAEAHGVSLLVAPTTHGVEVEADRQILAGAVANLLQNAFKFTRKGGQVLLRTSATSTRVLIDVEDECGGLPPGKAEELFDAFEQRGADRTGLGLGLFISRKGVEAQGGLLRVRDLPGTGCVFTIDLPRVSPDAA